MVPCLFIYCVCILLLLFLYFFFIIFSICLSSYSFIRYIYIAYYTYIYKSYASFIFVCIVSRKVHSKTVERNDWKSKGDNNKYNKRFFSMTNGKQNLWLKTVKKEKEIRIQQNIEFIAYRFIKSTTYNKQIEQHWRKRFLSVNGHVAKQFQCNCNLYCSISIFHIKCQFCFFHILLLSLEPELILFCVLKNRFFFSFQFIDRETIRGFLYNVFVTYDYYGKKNLIFSLFFALLT